MPLTGTLHDLSLANLVQVQCSEQHQAQVTLTRGLHKGVLVFADGELVYARADDRAGESAVYELLAWEEADFQVDTTVSQSERNVTIPWSALLMEGLRLADEARAERDGVLETRLRDLKGKPGVRGAIVVHTNGAIRADARSQSVNDEPAIVVQAATNAERIGELLGLGAPQQIVLSNPTERILLQKLDNDYLACWMDGNASIDTVKPVIQALTQ